MTSEVRIIKNLEWCPKLPTRTRYRRTPAFFVNGNEWFFRFAFEKSESLNWYYNLYLNVIRRSRKFERCSLKIDIEHNIYIEQEQATVSLFSGTRLISKPGNEEIWFISEVDLISEYMPDYRIKFLFRFDDTAEHLIGWQAPEERQVSPDLGANFHLEALSRDFSKLLSGSSESDVEIKCGDKTFNAHRLILGMRSAVFAAMLQSSMIEGATGLIKVKDFDASIFQNFLRYLYSGTLPQLNMETAKQFYEIADKYAVEELKKACSEFLVKNLSEGNACEILILADQHSDQDFRKSVISFIVDRKIPQRDSRWADFCDNYCKLAIEVQNLYMKKYFPK